MIVTIPPGHSSPVTPGDRPVRGGGRHAALVSFLERDPIPA
jgi:hypothetical protein